MTVRCMLFATALICCTAGAYAGENLKPNEIIEKAVKAVGGKTAIEKSKSAYSEDSGIFYGMGDGLPYTGVYSRQSPDKWRMEIKGIFVVVINGDKGWTSMMGQTKAMPEKQLAVQQKDMHSQDVISLLPFLNRKGYKFKSLGSVKVKDKDTIGLQVSKKGYDDVKLYFDAKTFLLAKSTYKSLNPEKDFKEVTNDAYYSAYKDFDGVKVATKIELKQDGKRFLEMTITAFRHVPKFDAKTFQKP